jgi:hypothetical protein
MSMFRRKSPSNYMLPPAQQLTSGPEHKARFTPDAHQPQQGSCVGFWPAGPNLRTPPQAQHS